MITIISKEVGICEIVVILISELPFHSTVDGQPGDFTEDNIGQLELQFSQLDLQKP